jgi:hypothetical protein
MADPLEFSEEELKICKDVSRWRDDINRANGRGKESVIGSLFDGLIGALGELAVSRYFKLQWRGGCLTEDVWRLWRQYNRDVGPIEVRSTRIDRETPYVTVKMKDPDDAPMVVVEVSTVPSVVWMKGQTSKPSYAVLRGWITIGEAKQKGRRDDGTAVRDVI